VLRLLQTLNLHSKIRHNTKVSFIGQRLVFIFTGEVRERLSKQVYARRALPVPPVGRTEKGAMETSEINYSSLLILVDNYPINHHAVACSDIVNPDRDAHFNSRAYHILI